MDHHGRIRHIHPSGMRLAKTLRLPTEIICQILSELELYDRRSFALCSRANYRVVSGTLFGDVFLGRTAGTMIAADGILRGGALRHGNKAKKRRWAGKLKTKSILLLKDKGTLMGDVGFLSGNRRIMTTIRYVALLLYHRRFLSKGYVLFCVKLLSSAR